MNDNDFVESKDNQASTVTLDAIKTIATD